MFKVLKYLQQALVTNKPLPVATSNPLILKIDADIDDAVRLYIQKSNTVGLSIGIVKDGHVNTYGYGETEKGNRKLPDAYSIFEIGSVTKTFTAAILAWYVNEGKINLTDPITKYLPVDVSTNARLQKIKVIHLSNHTSGLSRLPWNFFLHLKSLRNPYKGYTHKMLFSALKRCRLRSDPGEVYAYSNFGVGLLGVILERLSGKSFEQMVKQIITDPLKMESTVQHLSPELAIRFAKIYNKWGTPARHWDFNALTACGSFSSTLNDLLLYAQCNMKNSNNKLSKAFGLTHQVTFAKNISIGLGWHLLTFNSFNYYWHNGGTYGSHCFLLFSAEKNIAIVILSNAAVSCDQLAINVLKKLQE